MPKIEVDEADYQQSTQLRQRFEKALRDPKNRAKLLEAWQEANPDIVIPEVAAKKPVMDEVQAVTKKFDDFIKEQADKEAKREEDARINAFKSSWESQKKAIRDEYQLNDAGVSEVEKLAQERGIPDLEAAAALFRKLNPPAEVGAPAGGVGGWGFFEEPQDNMKENMEKLMKSSGDNDQVLNSMIRETLADVRGQRRAA